MPPLPKIIWMYWDKGLASAPEVVRLCIRSWKLKNPEYEVRVLDDLSVGAWVDLGALLPNYRDLGIQHRSDLLRLELLRRFGGVWADATAYCAIPLREWIPDQLPDGFLAIPGRSSIRLVANWFIVAHPGAPFIDQWQSRFIEFLRQPLRHRHSNVERKVFSLIERHIARSPGATRFWLMELPRRMLRTYPYFLHMYVANAVILEDLSTAAAWSRRPLVEIDSKLIHFKDRKHCVSRARAMLESGASPIYKLSWKKDFERAECAEVFAILGRMLDTI